MADFEDIIKTIEKEGKSFRQLLADQKKSGESPAKREQKVQKKLQALAKVFGVC